MAVTNPGSREIELIAEADKWKNLFRRVTIFFLSIIPDEMIDECIARLMKRAQKDGN